MGNKQSHSESDEPNQAASKTTPLPSSAAASAASNRRSGDVPGGAAEDGEEPLVEVPPPMQPIATQLSEDFAAATNPRKVIALRFGGFKQ